jgi:hypothetical protein
MLMENRAPIAYDRSQEPIVLSKAVMDLMLKQEKWPDLLALYTFYYYTAKWQGTNQPKATTSYAAKGVGWPVERVQATKTKLKELKLIEDIRHTGPDGKVKGWYILVKFIWGKEAIDKLNHPSDFPGGGKNHPVENQGTNALSSNTLNALSSNNKILGADAPVGVSQPTPSSPDEKENTFSIGGLPQQGCAPPRAVKRTRTAPVPPTPKPPPDPNVIATAKLMQSFAPLYRQINQAPLKANTENWYKNRASLQLMLTKDELPLERIQEVIGWLMRHHSDTYTPKFSNAYKFRQKFFDIERIKRNGSSNGNNGSNQNSKTIAPEFLRDNSIYGKRVDIVIDNTR